MPHPMLNRDELIEQALALPPDDRAWLADVIEQSLDRNVDFASLEIKAAWIAEIRRRIAEYQRGERRAEDPEAVMVRLKQTLEEHRASRVAT